MRFGVIIARAWNGLWTKPLWGFMATVAAGVAAVVLLPTFGGYVAVRALDVPGLIGASAQELAGADVFLGIALGMLVGSLVAFPVVVIAQGGLVYLSNAAVSGGAATVAEGWRQGVRLFGRMLGLDLVVWSAASVALAAMSIPLLAAVAAVTGDGGAGAVLGVFALLALLLLAMIPASLLVSGYFAVTTRYAVIGDQTIGRSLGNGWKAFRAAFWRVVLFALVVFAMQYAYSFATSIITTPMQLMMQGSMFMTPEFFADPATFEPDSAAFGPQMSLWFVAIIVVTYLLMVPAYIFQATLWTAFFRVLVGLDPATDAPAGGYAPTPPTPTPPTPPAPMPPMPPAPMPPQPPAPSEGSPYS